jgi:putative transposase
MLKSFKYRLYPTTNQKDLLEQQFGCKRFVWNYFLNKRKESYLKDKISLNYYDCAKELTNLKKEDDFGWLKNANSQTLQHTLRDLDIAYNNFFRKTSKFPNFKSKKHNQSFRVPQHIDIRNDKIYFPKFKEGIKLKQHILCENIKFITISKTKTNKYFVSVTCDVDVKSLTSNKEIIGIDVGVKDFATLSTGEKIQNKKHFHKKLKKLKYNQKQLSKKKKDSSKRNKQKVKVAKIHEKITNDKMDFLHKLSNRLVNENQVICIEDLDVKNMMEKSKLSRYIQECSWGEFFRQLEYKCNWYGKTLIKIDRYFPSSKTCNNCGYIKEDLNLQDRHYNCPSCNVEIDRDINASLNVLQQGINILCGSGTESHVKQKSVEAQLFKDWSLKLEAHKSLAYV